MDHEVLKKIKTFYLMYESEAYVFARFLVKDEHLAMDVVSEAVIKVINNFHQFDSSLDFLPWFKTIIANTACNLLKRTKKEATIQKEQIHFISSHYLTPFEILQKKEKTNELWSAISFSLTEKQYTIVVLRYYEEMSYQEIACYLHINIGTVKKVLSVSHQKLRKELRKKDILSQEG